MELLVIPVAAIAAVSGCGGYALGRRDRRRHNPPANCEGCSHSLSYVGPDGKCSYLIPAGVSKRRRCECEQYVGHIPADRLLATFISPQLPHVPNPASRAPVDNTTGEGSQ